MNRAAGTLFVACLALLAGVACHPASDASSSPAPSSDRTRPFVRILGSVQDGGFPHAACSGRACREASRDENARYIASLALILPRSNKVYLFDATPDVREQLELLDDVRGSLPDGVDRSPVDGVFLSHAHMGHYLGLAFFGFEAVHTQNLPVYSTPSMASFLRSNGPWSQLVGKKNIALHEVEAGESVELEDGVSVTLVASPHRDEYSDTVGFLIRGPEEALLFVPDTDAWERWTPPIESILDEVDVALLDGTFFSADELPHRSVAEIGHPLVEASLDRFETQKAAGKSIVFIHMNHSNPILIQGREAETVRRRGYGIAREGEEFPL